MHFLRFSLLWILFSLVAVADEYDDLRLKWRDIIIGTGYDTADADVQARLNDIASAGNSRWSSMVKSPTRTLLWSDLDCTNTSLADATRTRTITTTYGRLREMALAFATPGSSLQGNPTLLADIIGGLEWMNANCYGPNTAFYGSFWDMQIAAPMALNDICVMVYDHLTPAQLKNYTDAVDNMTPIPDMTGANKVWKARVVGVRGFLVKSSAKLALCRDSYSDVFPYVTSGDGFYVDGSFIQHNFFAYTAGYGASLLINMAPILNLLNGSTWTVTDPALSHLFNWVYDSYEPIIYRGNTFSSVRGREAWRQNNNGSTSSHGMMDAILQIAQFAPAEDSLRMKRMIKEWAQQDYTQNFASGRGLATIGLAKSLMNDNAIAPRGELIAHYTFPGMDRVIHLNKGYGFGISMCSSRVANFESVNDENLSGWFTGDGYTLLHDGDLNSYGDAYTATVDYYRLPGVTADVTHSKPRWFKDPYWRAAGTSTRSPNAWVGGATLGRFGAAGMHLKGVDVSLTGKKSWFMFDDEIVCLGAGITSTDSRPIETTVEQKKISSLGDNAFTVNGVEKSTALGSAEIISSTRWAHLAGNVSGSDVGYYFPTAPALRVVREARTGSWSNIDFDGSTTPITRNYQRMTLEHGSNPANASYQYVLLPGRNATRTRNYAAAPHITFLNNDGNVQAVRENTLAITAANFWNDITTTAGGITANKKACVLVREDGPFVEVSVSDPTQLNTGSISLQIALDGGTLASADAGITVTQSTPSIVLSVNTAGSAGKTFNAKFYRLTPEIVSVAPVADSYVHDANPNSNYGADPSFVVKNHSAGFKREAFLRFDVPASTKARLGASLNLFCLRSDLPESHGVAKVSDDSWSETGINWNNRPSAGALLDAWTPVASGTSSAVVTSALPPSGLVSFKVYGTTPVNGFTTYASREHGTANNRPQLRITYGSLPPEVSLTSPADGLTSVPTASTTLTADASTTDGSVTSVAFYDGDTLLGSDTTAPYSIAVFLPEGQHALKAVATASNGLSRTSLDNRFDVANPSSQIAFKTVGTFDWLCPEGVTSVTVECRGGGGAGGSVKSTASGTTRARSGGGAGGSYAKSIVPVIPGTTYQVTVGAGGSPVTAVTTHQSSDPSQNGGTSKFTSDDALTTYVAATGGGGGKNAVKSTDSHFNATGGTGSVVGCIGEVIFAGGNGGTGGFNGSTGAGAGGGGAGDSARGGDAGAVTASGVGGAEGGGGGGQGRGAIGGASTVVPAAPGGGSGGVLADASSQQYFSGPGARGEVTLNYTVNLQIPPYTAWSDGAEFAPDRNHDGVTNGMAWFLGAANPDEHAVARLPKPTQTAGAMILEFDCLNATDRGTAVFEVQYGSDLGQTNTWAGTLIPGQAGTFTDGVVDFVVTDPGPAGGLLKIVATIPNGEATGGKLFSRMRGVK